MSKRPQEYSSENNNRESLADGKFNFFLNILVRSWGIRYYLVWIEVITVGIQASMKTMQAFSVFSSTIIHHMPKVIHFTNE